MLLQRLLSERKRKLLRFFIKNKYESLKRNVNI